MTGKKFVRFQTEIVNGKCPTCEEHTMLVGITPEMYRCINCGADRDWETSISQMLCDFI